MKKLLEGLKEITKDCRDDMREPDEQAISAEVDGEHLDNAFGEELGRFNQEFVVTIINDHTKKVFRINLATLIALARKAVLEEKPMSELEWLIYEMKHLTVDQMLEIVKKSGNCTGRRFRATGLKDSIEGEIIDAWLGLIRMDGQSGIARASDFRFMPSVTWELI